MKAQQQVEQALGPILQGIMHERGATILMDRSSVLLSPQLRIDMTEVAIQRLDLKLPTVKVKLTAPPPGYAATAAAMTRAVTRSPLD